MIPLDTLLATSPDLTSERSLALQREAWRQHGLVVVDTRSVVGGLPRLVQMQVAAWAAKRLG